MRKVSRSEDQNVSFNLRNAMVVESTDDEKGHYKYIHKQNGKWVVVQKGTGKVLSTHDSENDAIASFKAMMVNKHGSATPMNQPIGHDEFIDIRNKTETLRGRGVLTEPEYHSEMLINYTRHHANGHCLQEGCGFTTPVEVMQKRHQMMVDQAQIDHNKLSSVVQAGAWPSETDWDGHLHNLEELLAETQKGVGWHAAKDEKKEMKAHDKLAKDLQKVIDDIKKVMKFPPAKTASVESDDWRDEHSNLDSDW